MGQKFLLNLNLINFLTEDVGSGPSSKDLRINFKYENMIQRFNTNGSIILRSYTNVMYLYTT